MSHHHVPGPWVPPQPIDLANEMRREGCSRVTGSADIARAGVPDAPLPLAPTAAKPGQIEITAPHFSGTINTEPQVRIESPAVAILPSGERVDLPAGTVIEINPTR